MLEFVAGNKTTNAGVLIVGHGTRSSVGQRQFLQLAEEVSRRLPVPVAPAFLELAEPSIDRAVKRLLIRGIDSLVVAPLLLFAAGHAKADVPAAVSAALAQHGVAALPVRQAGHFGCHPLILDLAHRRLLEATTNRSPQPADKTLLVMVGRGSPDASAVEQMQELARLVAQRAELPHLQVTFLAMAAPLLGDVLSGVVESEFRRVIVQPHLLFHGELVERLQRQVHEFAARGREPEWLLAKVLADDLPPGDAGAELLAAATIDLIERELPV
jgi:sirohydrochlorin cobaltochelatase